MNTKLLAFAAFSFAIAAEGQISLSPMQCGGVESVESATRPTALQPRHFGIRDRGFCSEYTFEAGWESPLRLHLGEGATAYLDQISLAIKVWNDALWGPKYLASGPPVEISFGRPSRYQVSETIWLEGESISDSNAQDGQSVIYFKPSGTAGASNAGFTKIRTEGSRIVEADIYINTRNEARHGTNLSRPRMVLEVDEEHGIYSFLNSAFSNVLHELGHALGLKHNPIAGSVMSYQYTEHPTDQWESAMSVFVLNQLAIRGSSVYSDPTQIPFVFRNDQVSPYMVVKNEAMLESMEFFTGAAKLSEQDKNALMCVYDFTEW